MVFGLVSVYFDAGLGFGFATLCGELVPGRKLGFGVGVGVVPVLVSATLCGVLVPERKISWSIRIALLRLVPGWRKGTPGWGSVIASSISCRHMVSRLVAVVVGVSVVGKKARVFDVRVLRVEGM